MVNLTADYTDRIRINLLLISGRGGHRGAGLLNKPIRRVILHKLLHVAMSPARVEVVLLHLRINLIVVPVVVIEAVNSTHHARAMTSARAVHVKLARFRIVNELQKLIDLRSSAG